ncbi:MAG: metallophosphoesterase [Thermoguttaceae bacterium]|nr:metallophosphoesterase [Thermoguttaceae bacterium]
MKKWFFVSDLHLLARRSQADRYWERLERAISQASRFVLGGDIFDFRWATTRDIGLAVQEAIGWLERLVQQHPDCQFHLVLGNHDHHWAFLCRLDGLAEKYANFRWHPYYLRLGEHIFLHGDVAERKMGPEKLAIFRVRWHYRPRRGRLMSQLYEFWMASRLPRALGPLVYPKWRVARRILAYLRRIGHGPEQGVRHVYFGHIHRGFSGYRYRGLVFHNTGPAVRGHRFRLLEVGQEESLD